MQRLKYIMKSLDEQKLRIYGHVFINNGRLSGIDIYNTFYIDYNVGYEPSGIEIALFKWMNNLGVMVDELLYEIFCALDTDGTITYMGRMWIASAKLPNTQDFCYAHIEEVIDNGLKIRKVIKANKLCTLNKGIYSFELHDILYGGVESIGYITYYSGDISQALKVRIYFDSGNLLYFNYNGEKVYLYKFSL